MSIIQIHEFTCIINYTVSFFPYRGDVVFQQSGNLLATMWLDNDLVTMLSTNAQPGEVKTVQRKQSDGKLVDIQCPASVLSYNTYMGGVDRGDQLRQYYHVRYKSHKYYKYIFWFLFDTSITNSFILFNSYRQKIDLKTFRVELAKALLGDYNSRKRRSTNGPSPSQQRLTVRHYPIKRRTESKKGVSQCHYCAKHRSTPSRKETFWYCEQCEVHLCHNGTDDDCFLKYHQELALF